MARTSGPNHALRALLAEAGWSGEELARQVNALAEAGTLVRLDRRSVTHWMKGRIPRPPVPELIAEALTRRLGRPITSRTIGMARDEPGPPPPAEGDGPESEDVTEMLRRLGFDDGRRQVLASGVYSLAALRVPGWAEAASLHRPGGVAVPRNAGRVDPAGVATAEQMIRLFSDADDAFGGGHNRAALSGYLSSAVVPMLRSSGPPQLRKRLRTAATQLAYLAGFTCFDDEQHGCAQRYYRAALDLATENGDSGAYAVVLRAMSVQARLLGHTREAVRLAETAAAAGKGEPALRRAFLVGQVAVAAAADRDPATALATLSAAETLTDRATSRTGGGANDSMGAFHPAALAHQQAAVRALLGDRKGAVKALAESLRLRPPAERRSRAITAARLAELHLAAGNLDQAVIVWRRFLDDYPHLRSQRVVNAHAQMREALRPHARNPAVRDLLSQAVTQ